MAYEVKIKESPEQRLASVRVKTTLNKVPEKVKQILTEASDYLKSEGIQPTGSPLAIYYEVGSFLVDVEAGYPVAVEIEGNERVKANKLSGGKVAYTVYEGPHIQIPEAHRAVHQWMHEQGVKSTGDPTREVFLTDPSGLEDDAPVRAESVWPIEAPLTRAERRRQERQKQSQPAVKTGAKK